jgi:hypothetical protein
MAFEFSESRIMIPGVAEVGLTLTTRATIVPSPDQG